MEEITIREFPGRSGVVRALLASAAVSAHPRLITHPGGLCSHLRAILVERSGGHRQTVRAASELRGLAQDSVRTRLALLLLLILIITAEPGQQLLCGRQ